MEDEKQNTSLPAAIKVEPATQREDDDPNSKFALHISISKDNSIELHKKIKSLPVRGVGSRNKDFLEEHSCLR